MSLPRDEQLAGTFYFNSRSAWAAVVVPANDIIREQLVVLRTRDGGKSWSRASVAKVLPSSNHCYLSFPDARNGFLMLVSGHRISSAVGTSLHRTTDGGAHWRKFNSTDDSTTPHLDSWKNPGFASLHPYLICGGPTTFRNAQSGWLVCGLTAKSRHFLFFTRDGGSHWQEQSLPRSSGALAGWTGSDRLPRFFPPNRQNGILMTGVYWSAGGSMLYATYDGGLHWTLMPPHEDLTLFSFASSTQGWAWREDSESEQGALYRTTDGGRSWHFVHTPENLGDSADVDGLEFVDQNDGWAADLQSRHLFRITDGGKVWTKLF